LRTTAILLVLSAAFGQAPQASFKPLTADVLGVHARLGRTFLANDDEPQADPVVVLSYGFWQRLSGDPELIGQKITLSNEPYTVIGVMPPDLWGGQGNSDIWLRFDCRRRNRPTGHDHTWLLSLG
jgi:MacB-like periplasmic core domain